MEALRIITKREGLGKLAEAGERAKEHLGEGARARWREGGR